MKQLYLYLLLSLALTASLSGCGGTKRPSASGEKPLITVSIEPLRYFTEAIAGPAWQVETLVPRGYSPETYDPTPRQLSRLAQSQAFLRIGYIGYELVWSDRLAENAPQVPFYNLSEGIDLIYGHHHHHHGHEGNYAEQEEHHDHEETQGVEPHTWNSPRNARLIATHIRDILTSLDSSHGALYRQRCDSLCQRIDRCDSLLQTLFSQPQASRAFMIYHPALSYLARDYGLTQIAIESDGKEPSAARMKALSQLCQSHDIKVIFIQPEFDRRNAESIAQQTGTQLVSINPLAYDWEAELLHTASALTQNPLQP